MECRWAWCRRSGNCTRTLVSGVASAREQNCMHRLDRCGALTLLVQKAEKVQVSGFRRFGEVLSGPDFSGVQQIKIGSMWIL